MYLSVCLCVGVGEWHMVGMPAEGRRQHQMPDKLETLGV